MIIDLTAELGPDTLLYPSPYLVPVSVEPLARHDREKRSVQKIVFTTHVGTHLDAPLHAIPTGLSLEQIPVDLLCGECLLVSVDVPLEKKPIPVEALEPHREAMARHDRVVLHTGWMTHCWGTPEYYTQGPYLSPEAAALLVDCGVRLLGMDFPNIDSPENTVPGTSAPRHGEVMSQGMVLVENLLGLEKITAPVFKIYALPPKVVGADGCPCRVVAEF